MLLKHKVDPCANIKKRGRQFPKTDDLYIKKIPRI